MSNDMIILAKVPLPERPGGWQGQRGDPPLWWAGVSLSVTAFDELRTPHLAELAEQQGGAEQLIRMSFSQSAWEFAEGYADVLHAATRGTVLLNEREWSAALPPQPPMTLRTIEQRLFRVDLSTMVYEAATLGELETDELYELVHGRPRPVEPGFVVALPSPPEKLEPLLSAAEVTLESFEAWARRDLDRLVRVLKLLDRPNRLESLQAVVRFETLGLAEERLPLLEALLDRQGGVLVQEG